MPLRTRRLFRGLGPPAKNMLTVAAQEFIQAAHQAEKKKRAA
jgi:hypothetical protein